MEFYGSHPNLDAIESYLLNQLHMQDQRTLADHLNACQGCQEMTEKLQEQIDLIRDSILV